MKKKRRLKLKPEQGDERTSIVYDARTGEIAVDALPWLYSIHLVSAGGMFLSENANVNVLNGSKDHVSDSSIYKVGFPSDAPGPVSLGNVMPVGLSPQFILSDLTASAAVDDLGLRGKVDLIYIPEPSSLLLALLGIVGLLHWRR